MWIIAVLCMLFVLIYSHIGKEIDRKGGNSFHCRRGVSGVIEFSTASPLLHDYSYTFFDKCIDMLIHLVYSDRQ